MESIKCLMLINLPFFHRAIPVIQRLNATLLFKWKLVTLKLQKSGAFSSTGTPYSARV